MASPPRRVCVTGGGGFIASWLVKLLLSRGYAVHATLRDPHDPKNEFLKQLGDAPANLRLFKADVLNYGELAAAFAGCEGVFHLATPVPEERVADPEKEIMAPAVKGTMNVLDACSATNVRKLIFMSSAGAVNFNPSWPQDSHKDESCWSDKEFCKENENWYALAKTMAEEASLEYGEKNGLNVMTICPGAVFGPLLQPVVNASSNVLIYIIKGGGGRDTMANGVLHITDVRDVAEAMLLMYNEAAGTSGRYICVADRISMENLLDLLKRLYPNYNYIDNIIDVDQQGVGIASEKLKNLGWKPRKLEETLADSVECYKNAGLLQDEADGRPRRLPHFLRLPAKK